MNTLPFAGSADNPDSAATASTDVAVTSFGVGVPFVQAPVASDLFPMSEQAALAVLVPAHPLVSTPPPVRSCLLLVLVCSFFSHLSSLSDVHGGDAFCSGPYGLGSLLQRGSSSCMPLSFQLSSSLFLFQEFLFVFFSLCVSFLGPHIGACLAFGKALLLDPVLVMSFPLGIFLLAHLILGTPLQFPLLRDVLLTTLLRRTLFAAPFLGDPFPSDLDLVRPLSSDVILLGRLFAAPFLLCPLSRLFVTAFFASALFCNALLRGTFFPAPLPSYLDLPVALFAGSFFGTALPSVLADSFLMIALFDRSLFVDAFVFHGPLLVTPLLVGSLCICLL